LRGKTSRQSWRRVVLGAIRTNRIAASMLYHDRNSGGTFYATPTQGHLSCKKQNQKVRITSEHTPAITHRKTKALIEYMRAMISYWLQHNQITTPSQNKKQKTQNTDRSVNSHLSDSQISSCEIAAGALIYQSQFFHDIPKLSQIQSIK